MITVAYVHGGSVRHEFMVAVQDLVLHEHRVTAVVHAQGPYIPLNRNLVCERFLNLPVEREWLWFLDVDIQFQPDILDDLLEVASEERPIVGALYLNQVAGKPPGTWWPTWAGTDGRRVEKLVIGETYELSSVGMGCTLIHRSVLEKMYEDYKDDPWRWFGHDIHPDRPERVGEDETFCLRAIKSGFSVWGLAEIVNHVKTASIGDDYLEGLMSHESAAKLSKRHAQGEGQIKPGPFTLSDEKALDPDSVGMRGAEYPVGPGKKAS